MKLLLLLCLGLTLVCAQEGSSDVVRSNFDIPKITGEWYSILLASDLREKIEENGSMRIFVEYITLLENSSLFINMHTKVNGVCTELPLTCDSTGEDGVYTLKYDGENVFRILEVDYNHHIMFYLENFSDSYKLLELYAREPDTSPELKSRFVEICQKYGVVKENVIDLTKADRCFQERGNGVA
ncbi:major allergen Equ c 1-like [Odocoileus virginianus]|uniref:Major allergen Equ c 1-like n=1 Tax=Odocoileus virginianus TaxID=9874 RepID=A0A6J0VM40_ODOVR|nr:major allergen Equ c 1-like [Odocoileus virginianus texanus]